MKKITMALLFSLAIFNCTTDSTDPRTIIKNKYDNTAIGLSLQFPNTYELLLDQKIGQTTIDLVARTLNKPAFRQNVTILIDSHTGTNDFNQILPVLKSQLQSQLSDLGNYKDTIKSMNGHEYAEVSYTATSQGHFLKLKQDLIINKNKDIVVTYTDLASAFDQNIEFVGIDSSMVIY